MSHQDYWRSQHDNTNYDHYQAPVSILKRPHNYNYHMRSVPPNEAHYPRSYQTPETTEYIDRPERSRPPVSTLSNRTHRSTYGSYRSRDSISDYIVPPVDSRHDYILSDYETAPQPTHHRLFRPRSSYFEPVEDPRSSQPSTRRNTHTAPYEDRSDYRLAKDAGFNNKHDFMRAHGIKTWDMDAYDRVNEILDNSRRVDAQSARSSSYRRSAESSPRSSTIFYDSDMPTCVDSDTEGIDYLSGTDIASFRDDESTRRYSSMSSERNPSTSPPARRRRVSFASDRDHSPGRSSSRPRDARLYREQYPSTYGISDKYHARERNPSTSPIRRGYSPSRNPSAVSHRYHDHSTRSPRLERYSSRTPSIYADSDVEAVGYRSDTAGSGVGSVYGSEGEGYVSSYVSSDIGDGSAIYKESDDEYGDDCVESGSSSDDCGAYDED